MPNFDEIAQTVRAIIAHQVRREPADLNDEIELEALGVESLDAIEIVFAIEEAFNIEVPFNANSPDSFNMRTIGDAIRSVADLAHAA